MRWRGWNGEEYGALGGENGGKNKEVVRGKKVNRGGRGGGGERREEGKGRRNEEEEEERERERRRAEPGLR